MAGLTITTVKTQKTRRERRVRDVTFLPDAGTWKIWNEASAGSQRAWLLLSAPGAARDRMITSYPEPVSDAALSGLSAEVGRLRGEGVSPRILLVRALQGRLARAVGNTAMLARSLLDAGLIHQITGNLEAAAPAFAEAVAALTRMAAEPGAESFFSDRRSPYLAMVDLLVGENEGTEAFLWTVPFEAPQDASGRYLVEHASVSYGLSVTALASMAVSSHPRPGRLSIVAVANPHLQKSAEERIALMRPASTTPADGAEREVRSIAALFGPAASRILVGDKAGAARILQAASNGSILHLAAPVFVSNATPLFSTLALTPADNTGADGGLVEIADVMEWKLPAESAVFSRLESAGAMLSEGGLAGLSWCLFVAGTPLVVANRWALKEPGAPALVPGVYRARLAPVAGRPAGRSMAESVQRAAKRQLAQPATRHPYYWAGLMVIGRSPARHERCRI